MLSVLVIVSKSTANFAHLLFAQQSRNHAIGYYGLCALHLTFVSKVYTEMTTKQLQIYRHMHVCVFQVSLTSAPNECHRGQKFADWKIVGCGGVGVADRVLITSSTAYRCCDFTGQRIGMASCQEVDCRWTSDPH